MIQGEGEGERDKDISSSAAAPGPASESSPGHGVPRRYTLTKRKKGIYRDRGELLVRVDMRNEVATPDQVNPPCQPPPPPRGALCAPAYLCATKHCTHDPCASHNLKPYRRAPVQAETLATSLPDYFRLFDLLCRKVRASFPPMAFGLGEHRSAAKAACAICVG
jgi:hypothetical protein